MRGKHDIVYNVQKFMKTEYGVSYHNPSFKSAEELKQHVLAEELYVGY
jgi:hypothetical protein